MVRITGPCAAGIGFGIGDEPCTTAGEGRRFVSESPGCDLSRGEGRLGWARQRDRSARSGTRPGRRMRTTEAGM